MTPLNRHSEWSEESQPPIDAEILHFVQDDMKRSQDDLKGSWG